MVYQLLIDIVQFVFEGLHALTIREGTFFIGGGGGPGLRRGGSSVKF